MSRCGLKPERYFDHEDFMAIFDFNTPSTIGALGTAVSQINQQAVSYTHLDVYKRQLQRDANRLLGFTAQQTLDYLQSLSLIHI